MKINIKNILERENKDEYIDSEKRFDVKAAFAEALADSDNTEDGADIDTRGKEADAHEDKGEDDGKAGYDDKLSNGDKADKDIDLDTDKESGAEVETAPDAETEKEGASEAVGEIEAAEAVPEKSEGSEEEVDEAIEEHEEAAESKAAEESEKKAEESGEEESAKDADQSAENIESEKSEETVEAGGESEEKEKTIEEPEGAERIEETEKTVEEPEKTEETEEDEEPSEVVENEVEAESEDELGEAVETEPIEEASEETSEPAEEKTGFGKLTGLFKRFKKKRKESEDVKADEPELTDDNEAQESESVEKVEEAEDSGAETEEAEESEATEAGSEDSEKAEKPETAAENEENEKADEIKEAVEESAEAKESEAATETEEPEELEAPAPAYKKYGWMAGITVSFVILLLVMIIYTNMVPRAVYANIDGEKMVISSTTHTVEDFLEDEDIAFCEEDYISTSLTAFIYDGMNLKIRHATDFTVTADGKTKRCKSLEYTVAGALRDAGIEFDDNDIITPGLETSLIDDTKITVQRVDVRKITVEEKIPFKTVKKDDRTMNEGTSKVVTEGVDGKDKVTYEVTYTDGKESSRKEVSREHVTAAVDKVVARGTRITINGISYSRKLVVQATAYSIKGRTAMGTRSRVGVIAVDPRVIPLGSVVYIEGMGVYRAEDTGGAVKGNIIDIYMDTKAQCYRWGRRTVTVYIQ